MNAEKFTQEGNIKIQVKLKEQKYAFIEVIDTGIGIQDVQGIFNNFGRSKQLQNSQGAGLGLTICYHLTQSLSGGHSKIQVKSEVGKGSNFQFYVKNFEGTKKGLQQVNYQNNQNQDMNSDISDEIIDFETLQQLDFQSSFKAYSNNSIQQVNLKDPISSNLESQLKNNSKSPKQSSIVVSELNYNKKQPSETNIDNFIKQDDLKYKNIQQINSFQVQFSYKDIDNFQSPQTKLIKPQSNQSLHTDPQQQSFDLNQSNFKTQPRLSLNTEFQQNFIKKQEIDFPNIEQDNKLKNNSLYRIPLTFEEQDKIQRQINQIKSLKKIFSQTQVQNLMIKQDKNSLQFQIFANIPNFQTIKKQSMQRKRNTSIEDQISQNSISSNTSSGINIQLEQFSDINHQIIPLNQQNQNIGGGQKINSGRSINLSVGGNTYQSSNSRNHCDCPNILIVDDNSFNIQSLEMVLKVQQKEKFPRIQVQSVLSGKLAIQIIKDRYKENQCCKSFKLILMDIDMPEMNGFECTKLIMKFYNSLKNKNKNINAYRRSSTTQPMQKQIQYFQQKHVTKSNLDNEINENSTPSNSNSIINPQTTTSHIKQQQQAQKQQIQIINQQIKVPYICACSSYQNETHNQLAKEAGMKNFINKPVQALQIQPILKKANI